MDWAPVEKRKQQFTLRAQDVPRGHRSNLGHHHCRVSQREREGGQGWRMAKSADRPSLISALDRCPAE